MKQECCVWPPEQNPNSTSIIQLISWFVDMKLKPSHVLFAKAFLVNQLKLKRPQAVHLLYIILWSFQFHFSEPHFLSFLSTIFLSKELSERRCWRVGRNTVNEGQEETAKRQRSRGPVFRSETLPVKNRLSWLSQSREPKQSFRVESNCSISANGGDKLLSAPGADTRANVDCAYTRTLASYGLRFPDFRFLIYAAGSDRPCGESAAPRKLRSWAGIR